MSKTIVTYETFHGSAKKVAEVIANKLNCKFINVDTPFEAEDLTEFDNLILVFNFRGPYTAQLTKLYLSRVKEQLQNKNVFVVGEGLFSEKEFPIVADEIHKNNPSKTFTTYFINGQLRVDTLFPEEKALLNKFSQITGMEIKDMGNLDLEKAKLVAEQIETLINSNEFKVERPETTNDDAQSETAWVCTVCGYIHVGKNPPEKCPMCGMGKDVFKKK